MGDAIEAAQNHIVFLDNKAADRSVFSAVKGEGRRSGRNCQRRAYYAAMHHNRDQFIRVRSGDARDFRSHRTCHDFRIRRVIAISTHRYGARAIDATNR